MGSGRSVEMSVLALGRSLDTDQSLWSHDGRLGFCAHMVDTLSDLPAATSGCTDHAERASGVDIGAVPDHCMCSEPSSEYFLSCCLPT